MAAPTGGVVYTTPVARCLARGHRQAEGSETGLRQPGRDIARSGAAARLQADGAGRSARVRLQGPRRRPAGVRARRGQHRLPDLLGLHAKRRSRWSTPGKAVPLFSWGALDEDGNLVRDPTFPDLPHFGEAYEMLTGQGAVRSRVRRLSRLLHRWLPGAEDGVRAEGHAGRHRRRLQEGGDRDEGRPGLPGQPRSRCSAPTSR